MTALTLKAHAKINLCLAVSAPMPPGTLDDLGHNRAGYHQITSWFVPIDLADTISFNKPPADSSGNNVSKYDIAWEINADQHPSRSRAATAPVDWPLEKDLCVRAHRLMEAHVGHPLPIELCVRKRIPAGGGLGGGSADAAAVLLGLNAIFHLGFSAQQLRQLSIKLGSDIAFFIDDPLVGQLARNNAADIFALIPRAALVSNYGDNIRRVNTPVNTQPLVLLIPPFGCPTGKVYQTFDRSPISTNMELVTLAIDSSLAAGTIQPQRLFNDLEEPACVVEPRLSDILHTLKAAGIHDVRVTGSGSTMYVLTPDPRRIIASAQSVCPELLCLATRILSSSAHDREQT